MFGEETEKKMVKMYLEGHYVSEIAKALHASHWKVTRVIEKHGIKRRIDDDNGPVNHEIRLRNLQAVAEKGKREEYGDGLPLWMIGCGCHFPTGFRDPVGHLFCGEKQGSRRPYCESHAEIAFTSNEEKKEERNARDRARKEMLAASRAQGVAHPREEDRADAVGEDSSSAHAL